MTGIVPTIVEDWDHSTLSALNNSPNRNVKEFDENLWALVHATCKTEPELVRQIFNLSDDSISCLAKTDFSSVSTLASGTMLSFRLNIPEKELLRDIQKPYDIHGFLAQIDSHE